MTSGGGSDSPRGQPTRASILSAPRARQNDKFSNSALSTTTGASHPYALSLRTYTVIRAVRLCAHARSCIRAVRLCAHARSCISAVRLSNACVCFLRWAVPFGTSHFRRLLRAWGLGVKSRGEVWQRRTCTHSGRRISACGAVQLVRLPKFDSISRSSSATGSHGLPERSVSGRRSLKLARMVPAVANASLCVTCVSR
jgi:hypothetical protein